MQHKFHHYLKQFHDDGSDDYLWFILCWCHCLWWCWCIKLRQPPFKHSSHMTKITLLMVLWWDLTSFSFLLHDFWKKKQRKKRMPSNNCFDIFPCVFHPHYSCEPTFNFCFDSGDQIETNFVLIKCLLRMNGQIINLKKWPNVKIMQASS